HARPVTTPAIPILLLDLAARRLLSLPMLLLGARRRLSLPSAHVAASLYSARAAAAPSSAPLF
ncbi:unnamed protein product, partial [Urochloa humidicola]